MPAPLSDDDKAFIRTILNNPAELTGWLAYADWLDERDDPRAEFLRLQVRILDPESMMPDPFGLLDRLEQLRPKLDRDWLAIFERTEIENCDEAFKFRCPKKWEQLKGTDDPTIRECDSCRKKVYFCHTIQEACEHASQGHCVTISLTVLRKPNDLSEEAQLNSLFGTEEFLTGMFDEDYEPVKD